VSGAGYTVVYSARSPSDFTQLRLAAVAASFFHELVFPRSFLARCTAKQSVAEKRGRFFFPVRIELMLTMDAPVADARGRVGASWQASQA